MTINSDLSSAPSFSGDRAKLGTLDVDIEVWYAAVQRGAARAWEDKSNPSRGKIPFPEMVENLEGMFGSAYLGDQYKRERLGVLYLALESGKPNTGMRDLVREWYGLGKEQ